MPKITPQELAYNKKLKDCMTNILILEADHRIKRTYKKAVDIGYEFNNKKAFTNRFRIGARKTLPSSSLATRYIQEFEKLPSPKSGMHNVKVVVNQSNVSQEEIDRARFMLNEQFGFGKDFGSYTIEYSLPLYPLLTTTFFADSEQDARRLAKGSLLKSSSIEILSVKLNKLY